MLKIGDLVKYKYLGLRECGKLDKERHGPYYGIILKYVGKTDYKVKWLNTRRRGYSYETYLSISLVNK